MSLSDQQIKHIYVLIENFDLAFDQATKVLADVNAEEVFDNDQITESGKKIVGDVITRLYKEGKLGIYCYYIN